MNSLELQTAVRRALGLAGTDTAALPAADVLDAINGALSAISTERDWEWQFASQDGFLVADTQTVALPTGYARTLSLALLFDDSEPAPLARATYTDIVGNDDTPAEPVYFAEAGSNLYLWPIPDNGYGYRHHYLRSETALVADGDTPLLPAQFHRWIVVEAALRLPLRTNSPSKQSDLREEADGWRDRAIRYNFRNGSGLPNLTKTRESVWIDV